MGCGEVRVTERSTLQAMWRAVVAGVLASAASLAACRTSAPVTVDGPLSHSPRSGVPRPLAREFGTGDVAGTLLDSATGLPIAGGLVFATTDTAPGAPVSNFSTVTDEQGHFLLADVPVGPRVVEARVLGFTRERTAVTVHRGKQDTVMLELRTGVALYQQQLEDLRIPTAVTPCRPNDVAATWMAGSLGDALGKRATDVDGRRPAKRVPSVSSDRIKIVAKPALCRRAISFWEKRFGKANPYMQVYLFDLGGDGFALYDPAQALGNATATIPIFDRDFAFIAAFTF